MNTFSIDISEFNALASCQGDEAKYRSGLVFGPKGLFSTNGMVMLVINKPYDNLTAFDIPMKATASSGSNPRVESLKLVYRPKKSGEEETVEAVPVPAWYDKASEVIENAAAQKDPNPNAMLSVKGLSTTLKCLGILGTDGFTIHGGKDHMTPAIVRPVGRPIHKPDFFILVMPVHIPLAKISDGRLPLWWEA